MWPPFFALDHAAQKGLHAADHAVEVDAEAPIPQFVGQLVDRGASRDARIVDQQRDRPRDWSSILLRRPGLKPFPVAHVEDLG